ncbi:MAG: NUDIX domain-containing protein [Planctomycetota bacterium]
MAEAPRKMYVTTDAVAFSLDPGDGLRVLLIRRGHDPYKGLWALPGGFVDEDEDIPHACARELAEETGLEPAAMAQVGAWGKPGRDPRGRNVSVAYVVAVRPDRTKASPGDDAAHAAWHPADDPPELAFDHADILAAARRKLRRLCERTHMLFALLPETLGLEDVRRALEAVFGQPADEEAARRLLDTATVTEGPRDSADRPRYRSAVDEYLAPLEKEAL